MEDQTRFGIRRKAPRWTAVMGGAVWGVVAALALSLSSCGGPAWKSGRAVKPDERATGQYCVLDREGQPGGRVINYVDPELCGRFVVLRGPQSVRVPPEVVLRNEAYGARRRLAAAQERARELGERP